ncbi:DUF4129 domain-containing protein [Nocardia terpenica]|uniref:DUF4129 domain-containing protein n=1 Tax=Nocardia terpenica TaxID=455432 RepID=UPI002FE3BF8B
MTDAERPEPAADRPDAPAPPPPALGPAGGHRAAAEAAAARRDFDTALRERFRAVVRGLEQGGLLQVRRSRTADETADAAVHAAPADTAELPGAARTFDEVVYGGRAATADEYRRLAEADLFSGAPPPPPEPVETAAAERGRRWRPPPLPPLPKLLRDPRFWAAVGGAVLLALIVYLLLRLGSAPKAPPAHHVPSPGAPPEPGRPDFGEGRKSIFQQAPPWLAYGGLQWLICAGIVVWWRARRRGALVGEPRPVEVPANELLAGQAALYRKARDHTYVAGKLRAATLRRIRPALDLAADAPPDRVVGAVAARLRSDPIPVGSALFGPVPDEATLLWVAAQLDRIESEIG